MSTSRMSPLRRRVMEALDKHPDRPLGRIGVPEGTYSNVAGTVNRLQAAGLVERDRYRLTDAGRAALEDDRARERRAAAGRMARDWAERHAGRIRGDAAERLASDAYTDGYLAGYAAGLADAADGGAAGKR